MRWDRLYVSGVGAYLPEPVSAAEAVRQGRYPADDHEDNEVASVVVAEEQAAPEMAATAARRCLPGSGHRPSDIAIVLHSGAYYQGQDLWTPASFVQREVLGGEAPAIALDGASNGGLSGLDLAAAYLAAGPGRLAALVTAGDRYCEPGFDRWSGDSGVVYGDGASALMLSRTNGFARLLATTLTGDPMLEEAARHTDGFARAPFEHGRPLDLRARKSDFIKRFGYEKLMSRLADGVSENVARTLDDADCDLDAVRWVVLPNFGRSVLEWEFLDPLNITLERTLWEWGRHVGHLGPADQFAGLDHLVATGRLDDGDRVLLAGLGIGFSWGSALLQVTEKP